MEQNTVKQSIEEADILERAIKAITEKLIRYKRLLLFCGFLGAVAGAAFSFTRTKLYTCSVQILPEFTSGSSGSSLSSLASLAGVDLSQNAKKDAFRPDLYPNVIRSTSAVVSLLRQSVVTVDKKKYDTLIQYLDSFSEKKTPAGELKSALIDPPLWHFTKKEKSLVESVRGSINTSFDKKSGIVVLQVEMRDPEIAAASTVFLTNYLRNFLAEYRIQKKRDQTEFLETRVNEALANLNRAEFALQNYRDKNRNVVVNVARIHEQKLQSDFIQKQSIYNDLLKQSEKSKIEEQQEEDILITVDSPIVPISKSSPKRLFYAIFGAFFGIFLTILALSKPWKFIF
jgi:capsular polysaccharide biosynthesis protein